MNPSKQPELPSGAGLLRTVEPGAAESRVSRPTRCGADEPVRAGRPLERGVEPCLRSLLEAGGPGLSGADEPELVTWTPERGPAD